MDDYRDFLPFLKRELAELECTEFHLSAESILGVLSEQGSDLADSAVREYAATLIWPPVSDPVRFELCLRLRVSIWWIESLNDSSSDGEQLPVFLTDTMIDYWRDVGRENWIHQHFVAQDIAI